MRVLDVYTKKDLYKIKINNVSIIDIMDNFFKQFPDTYRVNYDRNMDSVELWKIDEHYLGYLAEYSDCHNVILYRTKKSLIHELMHLSARDPDSGKNSFVKSNKDTLYEDALVEGCTEFLAANALNEKVSDYYFESFSADMLSCIDGFFEPYFIPSYDKFIGLFPNKKDILSLMYALSFYADNFDMIDEYSGDAKDVFITRLRHSVEDVFDSLINIQLSMNYGDVINREYADKFLSLLQVKGLESILKDIWKGYFAYANKKVSKRILRR